MWYTERSYLYYNQSHILLTHGEHYSGGLCRHWANFSEARDSQGSKPNHMVAIEPCFEGMG